jgi:hypothetical protein
MLQPVVIPLLAVISIHYIWRGYVLWQQRRQRILRDRVAFMLWTAAQHV